MSYTIIKPRDRQEWLKHREAGIGSSEVGTILGLNPFETPYQLWRRKKHMDAPQEETFVMRAGHYLEDAVSLFYRDATNKEIIKSSAGDWLIVSDDKPYMRVSPDRTFWLPGLPKRAGNKGILECKTTQRDIDKENVPQHWFCQLQYQLGVAELEQGALAWLTRGQKFDYVDYAFDEGFFGYITEEVTRFWLDNIQGGIEPDPRTVEDVILRNPRHVVGKAVYAADEVFDAYHELKEIKERLSEIEARKKVLEAEIKMAMGDAEALLSPDSTPTDAVLLATWKAAADTKKFDEKRFAAEHPELHAQYIINQAGSRRFLLK